MLTLMRTAFFATIFVFLVLYGITKIPLNDSFDPLEAMFADFELTDMVFSKMRPMPNVDTNVVLVNIGNLPRDGIAAQINVIASEGPKVIGIDSFFSNMKGEQLDIGKMGLEFLVLGQDTFYADESGIVTLPSSADSSLSKAIRKADNLVLVSKTTDLDTVRNKFQRLRKSHPYFSKYAESGLANLITENMSAFNTAREFTPKEDLTNGHRELSFAAKLASYAYPEKVERFIDRGNETEIINFTRPEYMYFVVDVNDVFNPERAVSFKDKIVLMGYMGGYFGEPSVLDRFYTPLNEKYAGKSTPDMFGVAVHANIVSMIGEENYINVPPEYIKFIIAFLVGYLNILLFLYIEEKYSIYFAIFTKTIQVIEAVLIIGLLLYVFDMNIKLDLTLTIFVVVLSADVLEMYIGLKKTITWERILALIKRIKSKFSKANPSNA